MNKKINSLIPALLIIIYGCASFNPTLVDYRENLPSSVTEKSESVTLNYRQMMKREASLTFDTEFKNMDVSVIVLILNNESSVRYKISILEDEKIFGLDEASDKIEYNPIEYLSLWSAPWLINIALKQPVHYGIIWPIIGLIAMTKASDANTEIEDFIKRNYLPENIEANSKIQGIVLIKQKDFGAIHIQLSSVERKQIDFKIQQTIYE